MSVQKISASDLSGNMLSMKEAHEFLCLNGVDWSYGWFRTKVSLGAIPSQKIFSSRVVMKKDLLTIIKKRKG